MATNFPTSLDSLSNPGADTPLNDPAYKHSDQHANANDAIEALQAKVGINNSVTTSSLDYKVRTLENIGGRIQVVTSGTRPTIHATPSVSEGLTIYETDTNKLLIWDGAAWLPPANLPWGKVAYAQVVANQAGIGTSITDFTGLSVTFTAVAGRSYKITGRVKIVPSTTANLTLQMRTSANVVVIDDGSHGADTSPVHTFAPTAIVTPGAGSVTYKLSGLTSTGTFTVTASSTNPNFILVEDIGV